MFRYFALFIISTVLLLWLFDIVLLDSSYKAVKVRQIKSSAKKIVSHIDNHDYVRKLSLADDLCVLVLDSEGNTVLSCENSPRCSIHHMKKHEYERLSEIALSNSGEYLQKGDLREDVKKYGFEKRRFSKPENLVYAKITNSNSSFMMVLVESAISPVNATVDTLRMQLVWISAILAVLAGILAYFYSKRIAGPIEKVTEKAKALGEGRYVREDFDGGYSEINQLVDTLDYAAEEIEKNDSYRRELIANVSHDLRTPLTMIIGYSEMMKDYPDHIDEDSIQTIIDEAKRLSRLVNDTMDLAKYESGAADLNRTDFSITAQIREIISRINTLSEHEIVFEYELDAMVNADELQMSQVIYNLIANAINYSPDGEKVTVRQTCEGKKVKIEIIDSGEGIPSDRIDDIWDRYYKVDRVHRRSVIGTGLGLSIVKAILTRHEAEFGVESEEGKGSCFWFELDMTGM